MSFNKFKHQNAERQMKPYSQILSAKSKQIDDEKRNNEQRKLYQMHRKNCECHLHFQFSNETQMNQMRQRRRSHELFVTMNLCNEKWRQKTFYRIVSYWNQYLTFKWTQRAHNSQQLFLIYVFCAKKKRKGWDSQLNSFTVCIALQIFQSFILFIVFNFSFESFGSPRFLFVFFSNALHFSNSQW